MLLYRDGTFMQALEGPEKAVRKTFNRISRDTRHTAVRMLTSTEVAARQFGEWTMGYRGVTDQAAAAGNGHDDFLTRGGIGPSWASPTPARVLLDWFRLHAGEASASGPPSLFTVR